MAPQYCGAPQRYCCGRLSLRDLEIARMPGIRRGTRLAIAGTIVFDVKIGVDIVLAADGKHYVNVAITKEGEVFREWSEGPFDNAAKARDGLRWQFAMQVIETL